MLLAYGEFDLGVSGAPPASSDEDAILSDATGVGIDRAMAGCEVLLLSAG